MITLAMANRIEKGIGSSFRKIYFPPAKRRW